MQKVGAENAKTVEEQLKALEDEIAILASRKQHLVAQLVKNKQEPNSPPKSIAVVSDLTPIKEEKSQAFVIEKSRKASTLSVDWNDADEGNYGFCYFAGGEEQKIKESIEKETGKMKRKKKGKKKAEDENDLEAWPLEKLKEEMKRFGMKTGTKKFMVTHLRLVHEYLKTNKFPDFYLDIDS